MFQDEKGSGWHAGLLPRCRRKQGGGGLIGKLSEKVILARTAREMEKENNGMTAAARARRSRRLLEAICPPELGPNRDGTYIWWNH